MSSRWQQLKQARATWALIGLLLSAHLIFVAGGDAEHTWTTWGLNRAAMTSGKPWCVLTYGFFHGDAEHLGLNALMLLLLGSRLEWILGARKVVGAFLGGIVCGGIGHLLLVPGDAILIGASGAAMSFLVLFCTLDPHARWIVLPLHGRNIAAGMLVSSLFLALMNPALGLPLFMEAGKWLSANLGEKLFSLGHACHFSGAVAGYLIGKWHLRLCHTRESILAKRI